MPFVLEASQDGRVSRLPFESFARIGSAPGCDFVIGGASMPAYAATIVEDSPHGCRFVVKAPGVVIDGQPVPESTAVIFGVGQILMVNGVSLRLHPMEAKKVAAEPEIIQHALPGTEPYEPVSAATSKPATGGGQGGVGLQIAGIVVCLGAVAAMIVWMVFGKQLTRSTAVAAVPAKTLPEIMEDVQSSNDWPWKSVSQQEVLTRLRRAYELQGRGRRTESRDVLQQLRLMMLNDVPRDDRGQFTLIAPGGGKGAAEAGAQATGGLSQSWFANADQRALYEAINAICGEPQDES